MKRTMKKLLTVLMVLGLLMSFVGLSDAKVGVAARNQQKPKHKPYSIQIFSWTPGSSTYVISVALADLIKKHSSWLKATALAAQSQNATAEMLLTSKAKTAIGYCVLPVVTNGYKPFVKPNKDLRSIVSFGCAANGFVTLNPNIKTMRDFKGKRVMLGPVGGYPRRNIPESMLKHMGIDCKLSYGSFTDSVAALINGQVDVIFGGGWALKPDFSKWVCHPSYTELVARYNVHYVDVDANALAYAENKWKFHLNPPTVTVPAYGYDEKWGQKVTIMADYVGWCCNKNFPDDVIREILRIMADYSGEFGNYINTGKYITLENMAKVDLPEYIHPAAKRFYIERGVWKKD